jgi:PPP family 3-phenylpropionic acid transporter
MPAAEWVIPISLLNSFTFGVYWIATVAFVDQMASDAIKSTAQGMLYAVLNISRMVAALVSGYLYDLVGAANLFLIAAMFSLFAIVLFWFNNPDKVKQESIGGEL